MKDGLALLAAALACAAGAWMLFRYLGNGAFNVILCVTVAAVFADNLRLRRRLRELGEKPEGKRRWW